MKTSRDFIGDKKPKEGTINPRSLSDDKQTFGVSGIGYWYAEDKLKEAIKELKKEQKKLLKAYDEHRIDFITFCVRMTDLPDEIFGKGLVEAQE